MHAITKILHSAKADGVDSILVREKENSMITYSMCTMMMERPKD